MLGEERVSTIMSLSAVIIMMVEDDHLSSPNCHILQLLASREPPVTNGS